MDAYFISLIRTWVPIGIGAAITWLAATLGIVLDTDTSTGASVVAVGIVTAVYYALARLAEKQWPGLGRILLALGLTRTTPTYTAPPVAPPTSYRRSAL